MTTAERGGLLYEGDSIAAQQRRAYPDIKPVMLTLPPDDAYRAFRGRMPSIQALLKKRGLAEAPTDARAG